MTKSDVSAETLIRHLDLKPLPWEGGYFRETWRSEVSVPQTALGDEYTGPRAAGTSICYMLTPDTLSKMHRLPSPETFHFYMGDLVEMLLLHPDGSDEVVVFGHDLRAGQFLQFTIAGNTWMGGRLVDGHQRGFALMGTTVAPGFDFDDLEMGDGDALACEYPNAAEMIRALT
jgi:predicted cupin superfamily sugar epimerase